MNSFRAILKVLTTRQVVTISKTEIKLDGNFLGLLAVMGIVYLMAGQFG
ncbi:hypothetical protein JL100_018055 [Skermanella mucosa]|nr:hypothetical protein [Skermanella mucosa]UEM18990.1 hypothetical protein JL100_018055 [Skermanella mucosa]